MVFLKIVLLSPHAQARNPAQISVLCGFERRLGRWVASRLLGDRETEGVKTRAELLEKGIAQPAKRSWRRGHESVAPAPSDGRHRIVCRTVVIRFLRESARTRTIRVVIISVVAVHEFDRELREGASSNAARNAPGDAPGPAPALVGV